jgi:hypothetical protein
MIDQKPLMSSIGRAMAAFQRCLSRIVMADLATDWPSQLMPFRLSASLS